MILTDSHMHTAFSSDSDTPMEAMIQGAISKGLTSICITIAKSLQLALFHSF